MKHRLAALAMTAALVSSFSVASIGTVMAKQDSNLLKNTSIAQATPTDSNLLKEVDVTGTLKGGGTFTGKLTITQFSNEGRKLFASGVLSGTVTKKAGTTTQNTEIAAQTFTNVRAKLTDEDDEDEVEKAGVKQTACDILFLDLGPIFLDLLGLTVNLSPVQLDVNAVPGSGNLLGNLLCALVGLLDGGPLAQIAALINQINTILASL